MLNFEISEPVLCALPGTMLKRYTESEPGYKNGMSAWVFCLSYSKSPGIPAAGLIANHCSGRTIFISISRYRSEGDFSKKQDHWSRLRPCVTSAFCTESWLAGMLISTV